MPTIGHRCRESFPHYTGGERIADGCVHIAGVTASLVAAVVLTTISLTSLSPLSTVSVVVYSLGLVAVFGFSAAYHLVTLPCLKAILRRCDHAAIFVKIAATYTPFAVVKIGGIAGLTLLGTVWAIAVIGVIAGLAGPFSKNRLRSLSRPRLGRHRRIQSANRSPFDEHPGPARAGRLSLHDRRRLSSLAYPPYHNAVWHAFVLIASACLFAAVVKAVAT
jgi:hemolysin III